jgi:gas vesicle protein
MPRQDTMDFLTAFAVGTVLGIGATLLLRPEPTPKERVLKQLKPYRKQLKKSYKHAHSAVREGADATADLTGEAVSAGSDLLGDFQEELAEILSDARDELRDMVDDQLKGARKKVKKGRKRFGV